MTDNDPRIAPPRSWAELSAEIQGRADRQVYPITGMSAEDVREILAAIGSVDRDEWAREWGAMGERYEARARAGEVDDAAQAGEDYLMAWRFFGFGAWPTQNSPGKKVAYQRCIEAFHNYARLQDPAVEIVHVPFEDTEVICYMQLPAGVRPAPVVLTIGGLDSYKEYTAERYGPVYMAHGIGYVALDMPATGEAPVGFEPDSERMYSAVIDYLETRDDVDSNRIAVQGVSYGGYWSTKAAYAEPKRLAAAVNWAGPADKFFDADSMLKTIGTREYLFDAGAALIAVMGTDDLDDYLARIPSMSLKAQGLLDKPTPPFLLVNGENDSQVPIDDLLLVLRSGSTPKMAWINPIGMHLARSPDWNDERIMRDVIIRWLADQLRS